MSLNHDIPLTDYPEAIVLQRNNAVRVELLTSDRELIDERAKKYYNEYLHARIRYGLYRLDPVPKINHWRFKAYLHSVNKDASFSEAVENAFSLEAIQSLEYIIEVEVEDVFNLKAVLSVYCAALSCEDGVEDEEVEYEHLIETFEEGDEFWNYDPKSEELWTNSVEDSDISTEIQMSDTIQDIAERLRQKIVAHQGKENSVVGCDASCATVTSNKELLRILGF